MQEPVYISLQKAQCIFYEIEPLLSGFHLFVLFIPCLPYNHDTSIIYLSFKLNYL